MPGTGQFPAQSGRLGLRKSDALRQRGPRQATVITSSSCVKGDFGQMVAIVNDHSLSRSRITFLSGQRSIAAAAVSTKSCGSIRAVARHSRRGRRLGQTEPTSSCSHGGRRARPTGSKYQHSCQRFSAPRILLFGIHRSGFSLRLSPSPPPCSIRSFYPGPVSWQMHSISEGWRTSNCTCQIKTMPGMDILRCLTPEMVVKARWRCSRSLTISPSALMQRAATTYDV